MGTTVNDLNVARVLSFFSFSHCDKVYQCALVHWFSTFCYKVSRTQVTPDMIMQLCYEIRDIKGETTESNNIEVLPVALTGCIKEFSEVENCIENVMETTNPIGKFYTLKSVVKVKIFQE